MANFSLNNILIKISCYFYLEEKSAEQQNKANWLGHLTLIVFEAE